MILGLQAAPAPPPSLERHPARPATLVRVIDGDTAVFRVELDFGVTVEKHVRFEGFNAPELHGPNKLKALAAKATLAAEIAAGDPWVKPLGRESAGRTVARVYSVRGANPVDLSDAMTRLGFDVPQGD